MAGGEWKKTDVRVGSWRWVLGVLYLGVLAVLANIFLVPRIGIAGAAACVVTIHVVCIPAVFRYSRVIWAHLNVRTR